MKLQCPLQFCHDTECPKYELLNKTDDYETRVYPSSKPGCHVQVKHVLHRLIAWLQPSGSPLKYKVTSIPRQQPQDSRYCTTPVACKICHIIH